MSNNSLGHIGLNYLSPEVEQDINRIEWNDLRAKKMRESKVKNIGEIDPGILDIEKKDLSIATRMHNTHISDLTPVEVFGKKSCPVCVDVKVDIINGCACTQPVFEESIVTNFEPKKVINVVDECDPRLKKPNRNTATKPSIGKGGNTKESSPHKTNKGWKPEAAVVQKLNVGSKEAHSGDPVHHKKLSETGSLKDRKNTIAKISKLVERKETRKSTGQLKGKLE
ncbi:MAG: hypothetical protein QG669_424 [Patescibacteria group bacterium]|nr:hypothetical protein [Patescibacteria group bacterium]